MWRRIHFEQLPHVTAGGRPCGLPRAGLRPSEEVELPLELGSCVDTVAASRLRASQPLLVRPSTDRVRPTQPVL